MLTSKQRDLLLFLQRHTDANGGVSPSFDEMAAALALASKSGVHRMLTGLEARGYIERLHGRARAIRILRRVRDPRATPIDDDSRDAFRALVREIAHSPLTFDHQRKARELLERYG